VTSTAVTILTFLTFVLMLIYRWNVERGTTSGTTSRTKDRYYCLGGTSLEAEPSLSVHLHSCWNECSIKLVTR